MKCLFAACGLLVGCNAIIGIEDRPLRPDSGATLDAVADGVADADSPYSRAVLEDKPTLYLRFGEASGPMATDEMHHADGQYPTVGVTWNEPGALLNDTNTAVAFDGTGKIQMPEGAADFAGVVPFSVEVWMKRTSGEVLQFVVDHESYPRLGWDLTVSNNELALERYSDNTTDEVATGPALPANEWHHVVGTWDGTVERVFFDGKLVESSSAAATPIPIGPVRGGWTIAGQNCSCSRTFYVGALDEVAIYDTALTGQQILAHFHASGR